jgi:hypothetical protein
MGLQLPVFNADTSREINDAFASLQRERPERSLSARAPSSTPSKSRNWRPATRAACSNPLLP